MIEKILSAIEWQDLGTTKTYRELMKEIHPDVNKHARASDAAAKLTQLHKVFTEGIVLLDDSGKYVCNNHWAEYQGNQAIINEGKERQQFVYDKATDQLKKYMPYKWAGNKINFDDRAVPLVGLTLPQEHVNWVLSRILEFCMLLHKNNKVAHLGLTPNNLFVVPIYHGVSVAGFYHSSLLNMKVETISAQYKEWYPASTLKDKIAVEAIDLRMAKNIAAYLLGDRSGIGTSLKRTHNKDFIDFLLTTHTDSEKCFLEYREILSKNFESKFHILSI